MQSPYSSIPPGKIYQLKPALTKPSQHKPKGWTDSVESYINEARKLKTLILRNRRLMRERYTWHVTINIEMVQTPDQIAGLWEKTKRSLRDNGIVALWIREPTKSNKVHYHLILRNKISRKELEKIIRAALPQKQRGQKRAGWHKSIRLVNDDWQLAHYVTKAKITGYIKGQRVSDYYARKRLLFVTGLPFHKVGVIGNFWVKSKTKMWQDVVDVEKRIGAGLDKPNVRRLAQHVHDMLGDYIPLKDIERSFGCEADGPVVQQWIDQLLDGEWADKEG